MPVVLEGLHAVDVVVTAPPAILARAIEHAIGGGRVEGEDLLGDAGLGYLVDDAVHPVLRRRSVRVAAARDGARLVVDGGVEVAADVCMVVDLAGAYVRRVHRGEREVAMAWPPAKMLEPTVAIEQAVERPLP